MPLPLYYDSLDTARREDDVMLWRNSFKENIRCKNAIEKALAENFDGMHLKDGIIPPLAEEYGTDRLTWVLANTVKEHVDDGRFRPANKEWADGIYIPKDRRNYEFSVGSHPEIVNGLITDYRQYCGDAILQQSVTVDPIMKKRKKNTGEALMYYVQNSHPAIVTREKFNKAQEERARRRTFAPKSQKAAITATGKYSRYALSQVLICAECGSPYKRVHWNIRGKKSIVWRCVNRLDHGTQYCKGSPTLREDKLKEAVVRAIRQFNEQDANTYTTLMKATIAEAIGFDGSNDEKELLERQVNGLNEKMITIVNESIASGEDIESREAEIKEIADTIENLKRRIQIITENSMKNAEYADRIVEIERIITERASHQNEYDDSIVRQMVECIKVYADKRIEVIFGGGYAVEETVE